MTAAAFVDAEQQQAPRRDPQQVRRRPTDMRAYVAAELRQRRRHIGMRWMQPGLCGSQVSMHVHVHYLRAHRCGQIGSQARLNVHECTHA